MRAASSDLACGDVLPCRVQSEGVEGEERGRASERATSSARSCRGSVRAARGGARRSPPRGRGPDGDDVVVTRRKRPYIVQAPMAVASDGSILVNAAQLVVADDLDAVRAALATRLPVFGGVAVPPELRARFVREADDGLADVVGRLGPRLSDAGSPSSASRSSAGSDRGRRGSRAGRHQTRRGRQSRP